MTWKRHKVQRKYSGRVTNVTAYFGETLNDGHEGVYADDGFHGGVVVEVKDNRRTRNGVAN